MPEPKKSFELTEDDLIRMKSFCKSKEFDKVIERFNEDFRKRNLEYEERKYKDSIWWSQIKDIPFVNKIL